MSGKPLEDLRRITFGLEKMAGDPPAPVPPIVDASGLAQDQFGRTPEAQGRDWLVDQRARLVRQDMYNQAVRLGLTAAGAGMAWRGLQGLLSGPRRKSRRPTTPTVGIKVGQDTAQPRPKVVLSPEQIPAPLPDPTKNPLQFNMGGYGARDWRELPWGIPAVGAAVLGGGMLGYKGVDWLLRKRKEKELSRATERQKARYEAAMSKISGKLDRLFDILNTEAGAEKLAKLIDLGGGSIKAGADNKSGQPAIPPAGSIDLLPSVVGDWAPKLSPGAFGIGAGTLLAGGGLAALWAHRKAHEYFKKRQPSRLLQKAREDVARSEFERSPIVPVAVVGEDD